MFKHSIVLTILAATSLSACASVNLPNVDFMGSSDFDEEITALDSSFPSADEAPDIPDDVRTAKAWDESAREMQDLYEQMDVPELEPALSDEEFDRQFEAGQAAAKEYQQDDPS